MIATHRSWEGHGVVGPRVIDNLIRSRGFPRPVVLRPIVRLVPVAGRLFLVAPPLALTHGVFPAPCFPFADRVKDHQSEKAAGHVGYSGNSYQGNTLQRQMRTRAGFNGDSRRHGFGLTGS